MTEEASLTVLVSTRTILKDKMTSGTVVLNPNTGRIIKTYNEIKPASYFPAGTEYKDYSPKVIMPGLVDAHVHLNEPGWRTEWEGFETGTRAAAFGGVTTVVDMPLNAIPPTTTVEHLNQKVAAAKGQCWVDVGFYGGVIPGNENDLVPLVEAGVCGFKCFLIDSGVPEFPAVNPADIREAMEKLKDQDTVLMFHAEMLAPTTQSVGDKVLHDGVPAAPTGPLSKYQTFLDSRPPSFETYAIETILSLAETAPDLQLHIVHLSAVEGLPLLKKAREMGIKITAETCFHYLALAAENIKDGDTRHKCCPPIRGEANKEGLWQALKNGEISTVVSDHSPCTPGLKMLEKGDFFEAWGGISTVGFGLSILWTEGKKKGVDLEMISQLTSYNTAKQVNLLDSKGSLEEGKDADICIFDPEASFTVTQSEMHFRNKVTPYENKTLDGVVTETWLRGKPIYSRKSGFLDEIPRGDLLLKKPATISV